MNILNCVAILVVIGSALPYFLIAVAPILALFILVGRFFRPSATQLRRLDGLSRAPVFSGLAEALAGGATIHSFKVASSVRSRLIRSLDSWNSTVWAFWAATRFFSLRLDLSTTLVVLCVTIISASLRSSDAAVAALALSYSIRLSALLQWAVRQAIESEANMTSVRKFERSP